MTEEGSTLLPEWALVTQFRVETEITQGAGWAGSSMWCRDRPHGSTYGKSYRRSWGGSWPRYGCSLQNSHSGLWKNTILLFRWGAQRGNKSGSQLRHFHCRKGMVRCTGSARSSRRICTRGQGSSPCRSLCHPGATAFSRN